MSDLPFVCLRKLQIKMKDNFIATNICKSLNSICKHFGLSQYAFLAPIANNPDFEYTCVDGAFRDWKDAGITKIDNMYLGDTLKSFQQLQEEFNLSRTHFYQYLQIRSNLNSISIFE